MAEHDQRFKALLQAFFPDFMTLFFPEQASLFDFSTTEWLDKEQLLAPQPPGDCAVGADGHAARPAAAEPG